MKSQKHKKWCTIFFLSSFNWIFLYDEKKWRERERRKGRKNYIHLKTAACIHTHMHMCQWKLSYHSRVWIYYALFTWRNKTRYPKDICFSPQISIAIHLFIFVFFLASCTWLYIRLIEIKTEGCKISIVDLKKPGAKTSQHRGLGTAVATAPSKQQIQITMGIIIGA